eukprot:TRINITY_DN112567_c0_g1_i1.p1 TRINITY_DN112567_c0_g1~~TRINITY_DN112567_c0_g1_i1.p1  ORF type:complete len:832 (+),score=118.84 TRINITY_DN112567_c0_g1_i1:123-2618(+)
MTCRWQLECFVLALLLGVEEVVFGSRFIYMAAAADTYLQLEGARCLEITDVYPIGDSGREWDDELKVAAQAACDAEAACVGFMHYVGDNAVHCEEWCGRPQFCRAPSMAEEKDSDALSLNKRWTSYVKASLLSAFGLPSASNYVTWASTWQQILALHGPSGEEAAAMRVGEMFREATCDFALHNAPPVVLLSGAVLGPEQSAAAGHNLFPGACKVAYQPFGTLQYAKAGLTQAGLAAGLQGVLTETEEKDLPIFSARPSESGEDSSRTTFWRYFFDPVAEYPAATLGAAGKKKHTMSVYFLSMESACPGPDNTSLWPDDVQARLSGPHVYVEDGTHETREKAFKEYTFTMVCGDFRSQPFPSLAFLYSIVYVTHAFVPEFLHWKASRMFFHLPDAGQGYRTLDPEKFEAYLEDMNSNPKKENIMQFKQTFTLLAQQLFWYRYRRNARHRADAYACAMCDAEERAHRRGLAHAAGSFTAMKDDEARETSSDAQLFAKRVIEAKDAAAIAILFCVMTRRGAHVLRQVVRETWGGAVSARPDATQRFFVGTAGTTAQDRSDLQDVAFGDVVELPVPETYRALNIKAFSMLAWAHKTFRNLQWLVRHDDDVYLRAGALMAQLTFRPPVRYIWGNFDHGSSPVRDPSHQHYNSYKQYPEQKHPMWGDIFPPYARGMLWTMSIDLVTAIVMSWLEELRHNPRDELTEDFADELPHPDDPAIGVVLSSLSADGLVINVDDRDFNSYSLNPACNSTFSNIHNKTWVVHHVKPETMRCMWALDTADADAMNVATGNSAVDASQRSFPDLCLCSEEVEEEEPDIVDGIPFWYPKQRFNTAR